MHSSELFDKIRHDTEVNHSESLKLMVEKFISEKTFKMSFSPSDLLVAPSNIKSFVEYIRTLGYGASVSTEYNQSFITVMVKP